MGRQSRFDSSSYYVFEAANSDDEVGSSASPSVMFDQYCSTCFQSATRGGPIISLGYIPTAAAAEGLAAKPRRWELSKGLDSYSKQTPVVLIAEANTSSGSRWGPPIQVGTVVVGMTITPEFQE